MEAQFKVGEVLVGQNFIMSRERNGMECVVLRAAVYSICLVEKIGEYVPNLRHRIRWADGLLDNVPVSNLRRKQPPAGEQSILDMFTISTPKRIGEPA